MKYNPEPHDVLHTRDYMSSKNLCLAVGAAGLNTRDAREKVIILILRLKGRYAHYILLRSK